MLMENNQIVIKGERTFNALAVVSSVGIIVK